MKRAVGCLAAMILVMTSACSCAPGGSADEAPPSTPDFHFFTIWPSHLSSGVNLVIIDLYLEHDLHRWDLTEISAFKEGISVTNLEGEPVEVRMDFVPMGEIPPVPPELHGPNDYIPTIDSIYIWDFPRPDWYRIFVPESDVFRTREHIWGRRVEGGVELDVLVGASRPIVTHYGACREEDRVAFRLYMSEVVNLEHHGHETFLLYAASGERIDCWHHRDGVPPPEGGQWAESEPPFQVRRWFGRCDMEIEHPAYLELAHPVTSPWGVDLVMPSGGTRLYFSDILDEMAIDDPDCMAARIKGRWTADGTILPDDDPLDSTESALVRDSAAPSGGCASAAGASGSSATLLCVLALAWMGARRRIASRSR